MRRARWPGTWVKASGPPSRALTKRDGRPRRSFAERHKVSSRRPHHLWPGALPTMQRPTRSGADGERSGSSSCGAVNALTRLDARRSVLAVRQAAEVLDYRNKPALIVVLTDGEETCGGAPCDIGKELHDAAAKQRPSMPLAIALSDFSGRRSKVSSCPPPSRAKWRALSSRRIQGGVGRSRTRPSAAPWSPNAP